MSIPTIKDVARLSGVSIGTVDRVLHERGKVSEKNRLAVQRAIDSLGYRPSRIARALVNRKNEFKIGACVPRFERDFFDQSMQGVERARHRLAPFGVELSVEITPAYDAQGQRAGLERLLAQKVSALVLVPLEGAASRLDSLIPPEVPYATVTEDAPGSRRLFHVGPDDAALGRLSGRLATLFMGPRMRCVILVAPDRRFCGTRSRMEGFEEFLAHSAPDAEILEQIDVPSTDEQTAYRGMYEAARDALRRYPELDAIYVTNGLTAWAAAAVRDGGKQGRVRVFGYEKTGETEALLREGIIGASICLNSAQQWYTAVRMMNEVLAGERTVVDPIFSADCRVLIEETIPFVRLGGEQV